MSENNGCPNSNLGALLDTFGFTAGGTDPGDVTMTAFTSQAPWFNLFSGISAIYMDDPGAVTGGNWLIEYGGNYFAAAECFGTGTQGVAMIIGDNNLWDNNTLNTNDNKVFLLNTVDFLADAGSQCGATEVYEEPVPARVLAGRLALEPGAKAEVYSVDGRLLGAFEGPGSFRLPKGVSVVRVVKGRRSWSLKALWR